MHGLGVTAALADLPGWVVLAFALLTQLGDAWFVFTGITLLYWLGTRRLSADPRRTGATLVAVGIAALALTVGLKSLFAHPRPPGAGTELPPPWLPSALAPLFEDAATGDGYGFPSGHATGTTMAYGAAAALYERVLDRRRRWGLAGAVVVVVSASRLVLGVHYLLDVVAGVLVGSVALAAALRLVRSPASGLRPERVLVAALGLATLSLAVVVVGGHTVETFEATFAVGAAAGALVAWRWGGPGVRLRPALALLALVVGGGLLGAVYVLEPSIPVGLVASAAVVGGFVALPAVVARVSARQSSED